MTLTSSLSSRSLLAGSIVVLALIALSSTVFLLQPKYFISATDVRPGADGQALARLADPLSFWSPTHVRVAAESLVKPAQVTFEDRTPLLKRITLDPGPHKIGPGGFPITPASEFEEFSPTPPSPAGGAPGILEKTLGDGVTMRLVEVTFGYRTGTGYEEIAIDPASGEVRGSSPVGAAKSPIAWIKAKLEITADAPPAATPLAILDASTGIAISQPGGAVIEPLEPGKFQVTTLHEASALHPLDAVLGLRVEARGQALLSARITPEIGHLAEMPDAAFRLLAIFEGQHQIVLNENLDYGELELHRLDAGDPAAASSCCLLFSTNRHVGTEFEWRIGDSIGETHTAGQFVSVNFEHSRHDLPELEIRQFAGPRHVVFGFPLPGSASNRGQRPRNLCDVRISSLRIDRPEDFYGHLAKLLQLPSADPTPQQFEFAEDFPLDLYDITVGEALDRLLLNSPERLMVSSAQFDIKPFEPSWVDKLIEKLKSWWPW